MSGNEYDNTDLERIAADDALLDVFGALSWDYPPLGEPPPTPNPVPEPRSGLQPADPDPLLSLLQALRADVDSDAPLVLPVAEPELAPVLPLRSGRNLRRTAVAAGIAAAVLSVSGVAAAGFSGVGAPLYPLREAIWGPTASQQALLRAERFVSLAREHLDAGRLTAADNAIDHAEQALARVDLEEQGNVPAQISALREALAAAFAADTAKLKERQDAEEKAAEKAERDKGKSDGDHGRDDDSSSDDDKPGRSGDDNRGEDRSGDDEPSEDSGSGRDEGKPDDDSGDGRGSGSDKADDSEESKSDDSSGSGSDD